MKNFSLFLPIVFLSLLINYSASGQFHDDFSDGNFHVDPRWSGDTTDFIINASGQLQLEADEAGTSSLYLPVHFPDSIQWSAYFRLDFPPSGSNRLCVYLAADTIPLSGSDAWFLELGESGSDDAIRIYRRSQGIEKLIGTLRPELGVDPAIGRLRISRDAEGNWMLLAAYGDRSAFSDVFQWRDTTFLGENGYFGIQCNYTGTRTDGFRFDDLSLMPLVPDRQPPAVLEHRVRNDSALHLVFDEPLEEVSALRPEYYLLQPGSEMPSTVALYPPNEVTLTFLESFPEGIPFTLTVRDIRDLSGNPIGTDSLSFLLIPAEDPGQRDVVINEIHPDPDPGTALPGSEFVELYNRSGKYLNTEGWSLADAGTERNLGPALLPPGTYLILCDRSDTSQFGKYGAVLGVEGLPTLNNGSETVLLQGPAKNLIDRVAYTIEWYGDPKKEDGGWSLERIDPDSPCKGRTNWTASLDPRGGSPAAPNSIPPEFRDPLPFELQSISVPDAWTLVLTYSSEMDPEEIPGPSGWQIDPPLAVSSISPGGEELDRLEILFAQPIDHEKTYNFRLPDGFRSCAGRYPENSGPFSFGLPRKPDAGDVLLNELLYEPNSGGAEFVELINTSGKVIALSEIHLLLVTDEGVESRSGPFPERLFFPGDHLVLTGEPVAVTQSCFVPNPHWLISADLPSLVNDGAHIRLYRGLETDSTLLDELRYHKDLHDPLLADTRGISLERISPGFPTNDPGNWYSASPLRGGSTPTAPNSQRRMVGDTVAGQIFQLQSETFSPDGDGFEDIAIISYQLENAGFKATIRIFDTFGRFIGYLVRNESLGTSGLIHWDGSFGQGMPNRTGIYILQCELYENSGTTVVEKMTVVLVLD